MIVEGTVAIASIGLSALIIKKHFEHAKDIRKTLEKNTTVLEELKNYLYKLNGTGKR